MFTIGEQSKRWPRRQRHHQKVQFIDQSLEVARSYDEDGTGDDEPGSNDENNSRSLRVPHVLNQSLDIEPSGVFSTPFVSAPAVEPSSCQINFFNNHAHESSSQGHSGSLPSSFEHPERRRAELLRRFLADLGPALDPWDEARRFASNLVEEALECPTLMQSILLLVEIFSNASPSIDQCSFDALLMAAAVNDVSHHTTQSVAISLVLRTIEIMQGKWAIFAEHLAGRPLINPGNNISVTSLDLMSKLLDLADWSHEAGVIPRSLEYELFWSGLWLEVYVATMHQKQFASPLNTDHIHQLIDDAHDERSWTNKILLYLVEIIDYCFSGEQSRRAYNKLQNDIDTWQRSKPASFDPVSVYSTQESVFPQIWLLDDVVIAGLQYFHLARLLLLAHDPAMPLVGAALNKMKKERDVSLLPYTWTKF